MAITINGGTGVITGVSVGGLPDGVVDAGTLATNSVDSDELINGAIDAGHLASGVGGVTGITSSADATAITINSSEQVSIPKPLLVGLSGSTAPKSVGAMEVESTVGQDNGLIVWTSTNNSGAMNMVSFRANSTTEVGAIRSTSSSTSFITSSDYRLKENVVPMTGAIDRIKLFKPLRFNFITNSSKVVDGFLAHEAQEIVPEAVDGTKDEMEEYEATPAEIGEDGNISKEAVMGSRAKMQGIDQAKIVPLLVGALQESITRIESLEQEVATLKG